MLLRPLIFGAMLLCSPLNACADAAIAGFGTAANAAPAEVPLASWTRIVGDPESKLTVGDVLHILDTQGGSSGVISNSGLGDGSYWFSVPIENSAASPLQRFLVVEPVWLDDVRVTLLASDGSRQEFEGGWRMPFAHRALLSRKTNFALTLPPGQSRLLVRAQTRHPWFGAGKTTPLLVSMTLWERSAFFEAENSESAYFAAIYAALGALLVFNLILFFSTRDKIYRAYVAYLGVFLSVHAGYNGQLFRFVWPNFPEWTQWAVSISAHLFVLAGLTFVVNFLDVPAKLPDALRWTKRLTLITLISLVATAFGGFGMHMASGQILIILYTFLALFLGFWSLRKGNRAAPYFLSATVAGLVGTFFTDATITGSIPYSIYGYRAVDIGMLLDAALLSLALAERIKIARMAAAQAELKLSEATHSYTRRLELEVAERTRELDASRERLRDIERRETLAQERQRLMQDMHDGLGSSLTSALRVVEHGKMDDAEVALVLKSCIDDLKLAIDSMEPVESDLLLLLATLRFRLQPRLENTGIVLRWEVRDVPKLHWLDPKTALHILRILQEAFTNIIKHTQATEIRLSTRTEGEHVVVSITDNGAGFSVAEALEKGGKGLRNQQRRAEAINATVSWQSGNDGSCFTLQLPIDRKTATA